MVLSCKFRFIVLFVAIIGVLALWFLYKSDDVSDEIRNVLLISIDTCRADHLSCYGYQSQTTPNIDAVAAEGTLFENVIAPIPQTLPSHSSMLTGTIPPYHGVRENVGYLADEPNVTLAEILSNAGFATGAAISAFVLDSEFGINQGFDDYDDRFETSLEDDQILERPAGETTDVAVEWLEKNKDRGFFFFLHYYDPHTKYEPPEPYASRYASNLYAGEIAYTDHCIRRVVDKLKALGLYDSTLIIITSDHGEMLGEHGELTHMYFIYQAAVKVPLIFKVPGQSKPRRIKSIAALIDIVPTVCNLLEIEMPRNVQGVDLFGSSRGDDPSRQDRHIYCESLLPTKYDANSLLGIVNDHFKYIQTTRPELYDLIADPGESNNLVERQHLQARAMKDKLTRILEDSVREDSGDSEVNMDPEAVARIESLGYLGGSVVQDLGFSQSQTKRDPKDLLKYHSLYEQIAPLLASKEYEKIKMYAERMIQLQPDIPLAYQLLGGMYAHKGEHDQAIQFFEKVILNLEQGSQLNPSVAAMSYHLRADAYVQMGNHDQGIRDYSKAIELSPSYVKAYYGRGIVYSSTGQYDQAIRDLDQAIELNPSYAKAYYGRGIANLGKDGYDQAIDDFSKAIELNPKFDEANNNRGFAYLRKGEYDQAIRDFDQAIELNPSYVKAYFNRGIANLRNGRHDQALRDFDRGIKLNPGDAVAHKNMAKTLSELGRAKEAVKHLHRALELRADWPEVLNDLAWTLATHENAQLRDGAEAVRLAESACHLTSDKAAAFLDTLAAAYAEVGHFDRAVKTADRAQGLALKARKSELAEDIRVRKELYQAKRPYRNPTVLLNE